jgi:DNA-binding response OmpR family regulator
MKPYRYETVVLKNVKLTEWRSGKNGIGTLTFLRPRRRKNPVIPGGLTFHNTTNTIIWDDSSISCTPATFQLVFQLWETPERFLSKETMKEVVMDDEEALEQSVRGRVHKARKELRAADFPYKIETVRGKGYRLVRR